MSLPFALNHINLWLLRDEIDGENGRIQGWSIVDCCIHKEEAKTQWKDIFTHELEGLPVLRVIVTHMHPDHIGLAHWLCQRWNVPLWISALDYQVAKFGCMGPTGFGGDRAADLLSLPPQADPQSGVQELLDFFLLKLVKPYHQYLLIFVLAR